MSAIPKNTCGLCYHPKSSAKLCTREDCAQALTRSSGSDSDMLRAAGYVLQEAVEELLKTWHLDEYKNASDEMLEVQMEQGYAPEIQDEAKAVLLARSALRMTGHLFPQNNESRNPATTEKNL